MASDTIRPAPTAATAPRRGAGRVVAVLVALAALAGCATGPSPGPALVQALRERVQAGDFAGADALIARHASELDARRALDLAIRAGRPDAVRHFLPRAGQDAELDPDATTPLIRTVVDAPPAARPELVDVLVAAGARPDMPDRYGRDARDYATLRNHTDLLERMDPSLRQRIDPDAPPPFARWLAAPATPVPAAIAADAEPTRAGARGRTGSTRAAPTATRVAPTAPRAAPAAPRASSATTRDAPASASAAGGDPRRGRAPPAAVPTAPPVLTAATLLRLSPWRPDDPARDVDRVALRFHVDGIADALRLPAGGGPAESLADAYAAWRIDAGMLHLAITGPPFSVRCRGTLSARDALDLACEARAPPSLHRGHSVDLARALLDDDTPDPSAPPSYVAIAMGRVPMPDGEGPALGRAPAADVDAPARLPVAAAERSQRVMPVRLAAHVPHAAAAAPRAQAPRPATPPACRPARASPAPQPIRGPGDWHVLDVTRFESFAPPSGAMCAQTRARDAALAECRSRAGSSPAACRSVGGCPAGQVSALAALPGVDGGWLACDTTLPAARDAALAACRAAAGCDCTLVGLSVRNADLRAASVCPPGPPRAAGTSRPRSPATRP